MSTPRLSVDKVRSRLRYREIELVSEHYSGIESPIACRCLRCENTWTTRLRHINHGHGCPECGKQKQAESKYCPTEQIVSALKLRGITVLAIHRNKPRTSVHARCNACGHEWTTAWNELQQGRGCPPCGRRRMGDKRRTPLAVLKTKLASWKIRLLSSEYHDNKTKLHVRFACGHDGFVSFNSLDKGNRCGVCAPNARVTAERYRELARQNHGEILVIARTTTTPSKWKCAKEHIFWRAFNPISRDGTFCSTCSQGLSERICRAAAEQLFGTPFKKTKLRGVRGVGGRYLELDAYSEFLKLAIEHNGLQHYEPVRFGNQTKIEADKCFGKQQEHDRRRREFCQATGITLIEVPALGKELKTDDLKEFIRAECMKANFTLPKDFDRIHLKLDAHLLATTSEEIWERVLKRVQESGYTLKTENYPGANGRLTLLCANGHTYMPRLASFLRGHTCRRCLIQQISVPVVTLPLGSKAKHGAYESARVFDTIEDCAKALGTSANNVRIIAKGRGNSCVRFGVAQITQTQAKRFHERKDELESFCRARWPSPDAYDRQDGSRLRLSKPIRFSNGCVFESGAAAARSFGVTKEAIGSAIRSRRPFRGMTIERISLNEFRKLAAQL